MKFGLVATVAAALWAGIGAVAQSAAVGTIIDGPFPDDLNGSNKTYSFPLKLFRTTVQGQQLDVAFVDVPPCPAKDNNHTVILYHGKNFCLETWREQIKALSREGYRVLAIDSPGFCKSSKLTTIQYSLSMYAWIYQGLLNTLEIPKVAIMTHSFGGMMGIRHSLQYPDSVHWIFLVDSIGLEDYTAQGVPYSSIDDNIAQEATSNYTTIRNYEQHFYYADQWEDPYDEWVNMLVAIYWGPEREAFIRVQGVIVDVVLTQPIAEDFGQIQVPVYLLVGQFDTTFIGAWANSSITSKLGKFTVLGPKACAEMNNCTFHEFMNMGHAPHITNATLFNEVMVQYFSEALVAFG